MSHQVMWMPLKYCMWAIPATILVIWPGFQDPINLPKLLALFVCSVTGSALSIFLWKYKKPKEFSKELVIYLLLYCFLGVSMIVSGMLGSKNWVRILFGAPGRNNGIAYYLCILVIAILILQASITRLEIQFLNKMLTITSLFLATYCFIQFLNFDPLAWTNSFNRVIGTLGNPNFSSAALAIFSVFWFYQAFRREDGKVQQRLMMLLPATFMVFLAWATEALQGIVIVGVGIVLIIYVSLRERYAFRGLPWIAMIGGGTGVVILFASFIGLGPFGSSLEQYTLRLRATYAFIGIKSMMESPFYGVGVDNYNSAFRLYRSPEFVNEYGVLLNADNAHSTPAQIGSTFGLIVFALYVVLHIAILTRALKIINSRESSVFYLKGVAIVWILIFSQSLLSIELIGLGAMNWIIGAILLSIELKQDKDLNVRVPKFTPRKKNPDWVGAITIISIVIALIPIGLIAKEERAYRNIAGLQMRGSEDKDWIRLNFNQLSTVTLNEPSKVVKILENMYKADMIMEIERVIRNSYEYNNQDIYAGELMATYYQNVKDIDKELVIRESLRKLDPVNYQLELSLATNYAAMRDVTNLQASVARIRSIAPDSEETKLAEQLLRDTLATP